jgi:sugar phosphate isomerase/epimerase
MTGRPPQVDSVESRGYKKKETSFEAMKPFKVGIDAYSLKPLGLDPLGALEWARANGADGVQFSEGAAQADDAGYLRAIGQYAAENGLYLEWGGGQHIPFDPRTGRPIDIAAVNRKAAEQAAALGLASVRSCSGGLLRWPADAIPTEVYLREMASALRAQAPMWADLGMALAVEIHFEFTTFELIRLFETCDAAPGGYLGICLDTMNLLTMLEDPLAATRRIRPWIVTTHIKDGGIIEAPEGFRTFTAEAGHGIVDFRGIFQELAALDPLPRLSIEDHGGDFIVPFNDPVFRGKFPDLDAGELVALRSLAALTKGKMETEDLAVLDRAEWPFHCEQRVRRDINAVRRLVLPASPDGS